MKPLICFLVLFLISGVGSFDLVIDEIPDVSIFKAGSRSSFFAEVNIEAAAGFDGSRTGSLLHRSAGIS